LYFQKHLTEACINFKSFGSFISLAGQPKHETKTVTDLTEDTHMTLSECAVRHHWQKHAHFIEHFLLQPFKPSAGGDRRIWPCLDGNRPNVYVLQLSIYNGKEINQI
jgi:hypothetical protein